MLTLRCGDALLRQATEADDDLLVTLLPDDFDHDPTFPLVDGRSPRDHREAWLRHWLAGFRNPGAGQQVWAFVVEHGGRQVGLQVLEAPVPASSGALDTSSFLVPEARGRRLGVAMRTAVLDFGFSVLGATRAVSSARPGNIASQRVSERAGYRMVGRREPVVAGVVRPLVDFEVTREEWFTGEGPKVLMDGIVAEAVSSDDPLAGVDIDSLPRGEYAFPGPLRDRLVDAIVRAEKTATASLLEEYRREGDAIDWAGSLEVVIDSAGRDVAVTRTNRIEVHRLADVSDAHAHAEGEGYADATAWRRGHERFWTSPEFVAAVGDPRIELDDDTLVVCDSFELVRIL